MWKVCQQLRARGKINFPFCGNKNGISDVDNILLKKISCY